jgi:putative tricarboxylic transport membrane protein
MRPSARDRVRAGAVAGVFLLLGAFICFEGLQVPVGTVRMPGAGFFPLLLGIALSALSILLLAMSLVSPPGDATRLWPERREVVYLAATVAVAVLLFERAGFLVTMALFLVVAVRVLGKMRWPTVIVLALVGSVSSYVVFSRVLQIALPSGILPF